ncbi:hypothetical protein HNO89_000444 [Sporosarcina luteola]|nr:hypothetical protein [Sporosarcina luteola]
MGLGMRGWTRVMRGYGRVMLGFEVGMRGCGFFMRGYDEFMRGRSFKREMASSRDRDQLLNIFLRVK